MTTNNKGKTTTKSMSSLNNLPSVSFELGEGNEAWRLVSLKNKRKNLKKKQGERLKSLRSRNEE